MKEQKILFEKITKNNILIIYIHGKAGTPKEAEHYKKLFNGCDVIGLDYKSQTPWEAESEFPLIFNELSEGYKTVILIANSIGAYFAMHSLKEKKILKAFFISPVIDMKKLIFNMMGRANISENMLKKLLTVKTDFGETLSWEYLQYVKSHQINWKIPTCVLYGEKDILTDKATITAFAKKARASLTVMQNGEHWFHTAEQMNFLDNWLTKNIKEIQIYD